MPLEILAAMVVVGVGLSVLLVRWAFGANRPRIREAGEAVRRLRIDFPEAGADAADAVLVADDGRNALIRLAAPAGHLGYVQAFGSKYVSRLIAPGDIRNGKYQGDGVLRVHLKDITLPRIDLRFSDGERGRQALHWIEELTR